MIHINALHVRSLQLRCTCTAVVLLLGTCCPIHLYIMVNASTTFPTMLEMLAANIFHNFACNSLGIIKWNQKFSTMGPIDIISDTCIHMTLVLTQSEGKDLPLVLSFLQKKNNHFD